MACAGGAWWVAGALLKPNPASIGKPPEDFAVEEVSFASESGSLISAWHHQGEPGRGVVVVAHGIHGNRWASLPKAQLMAEAGFSTLLIDLRCHGESPGEFVTLGHLERHDIRAAVEFARRRHPGEPVGVVGFSLGGAATALAAPLDVDAVVLEAVFPTIQAAVDNRTRLRLGTLAPIASQALLVQLKPRAGVSPADLRPIDALERLGCPVLIVGGATDRLTTPEDTRRMYAAASEPKQLGWFKGLGHRNYARWQPGNYRKLVVEFLVRHLTEGPLSPE